MYDEFVTLGLKGSVNLWLPAIAGMAAWQLFVRFTLAGAATATEELEDKD